MLQAGTFSWPRKGDQKSKKNCELHTQRIFPSLLDNMSKRLEDKIIRGRRHIYLFPAYPLVP